jgi:hypothetical protein
MTTALIEAQAAPSWERVRTSFARASLAAELAGRCPSGIFHEAEARRQEEALATWQNRLASELGSSPLSISCSHEVTDDLREDLAGALTIIGRTGLWARLADASSASFAFAWRAGTMGQPLDKLDLRAFLDYVARVAAGATDPLAGHRSLLCYRDKDEAGVRTRGFAPLSRPRALDYLATLCRELLGTKAAGTDTGLHPYLLPHEAVLASRAGGSPISQEIRGLCQRYQRGGAAFSSTLGPLPDVIDRYPIPSQREAEHMVEARFGLLFELTGLSRS